MSKISLNDKLADQEGGDYILVPVGYHAFTVESVGDVELSSNGNEFLTVELTCGGTKVKDKIFLGEKSLWRLARFLKSLKGGESLGDIEFVPEKCKWIVGKSGQLLIEHESPTEGKYAGKKFARVKTYEWGKVVADLDEDPADDDDVPF
jgi:hypothetical protein